ncbi:transcription factor 7-like 1 [Gouania willdenowi]|uniref:transcription factor 7-like 1 n=1 Tax=Gouania willdenowi TaxID=441366 RepID=UPI0010567E63|nr:transcription factor 7-like 1 [Gouania willdenowi]
MVQPLPPVQTAFPGKVPVSQKKEKVTEEPYVKKPLNAFMRFLKQNRASAEAELGVRTSAVVNKHLGERWKSLSPEDKEKYVREAKRGAILHSLENPQWSNKNNYRKKRKCRLIKVVCAEKVK